jgi:Tol biopolymer transport system component
VRRESSAEYILTGLARHKLAAATGLLVIAALAAGAVWRTRRGTPDGSAGVATRVQRNLTRLTFGGGLQTDPTLSPDGRFLAYASDRAGNFDIWVQSISGGEPVQVTKSPFQDTQPDWSPDGSTLVFRSERDGGGLFLVPALGGAEQRLTSFGVHPQWITSGSEIMFIESSYGPAESASGSDAKIYVTSPGREQPAEILSDFVQKGAWFWIAGHPDGRVSLYGSHRDHGLGFFTTSRDGSKLVASEYASEVSDLLKTQNLGVRRFQWNRSGTALYVEAYTSGIRNLWRVEVDPRTLRWLSAQRLTTSGSNEGAITLSRDGTRLAFTMQGGATRLWAFTLDPTGGRLIDKGKPITADDTEVNDFDLSRDGRIVAHVLARPGREGTDLWTSEIGSGKSELIAKNAGLPRWSFDGNRLAYVAFPRSGAPLTSANAFRLVVRDQTSRERTIARRHDGIPPAIPSDWLPDDNAILASWSPSAASGWALTIWPTSKLAERPGRILLADTRTSLWQGRFSPNGRWLSAVAVSLDNPGRSTLVLVPAAGASAGQWLRIAGDHEWPDKPRWSSDGRTLYFISRRPTSFFNLWAVRFDPAIGKPVGQPFMLTHFDSPSRVISPNLDRTEMGVAARHAVLSMQNVTGNVWMLDNVDK